MTPQDVEEFVNALPELPEGKITTRELIEDEYLYVVSCLRASDNTNEYLLLSGIMVVGASRTKYKRNLMNFLCRGYRYEGIGILHKYRKY
jgi:hypothetical protein